MATDSSYKRHIAKTVTWRAVGTVDTIIISWIITGNPFTGLKIGFTEVITKMVLYYLHERVWFRISMPESRKRHLLKTVSWRMIGTLDTMLLAWLISGNALTGVKIHCETPSLGRILVELKCLCGLCHNFVGFCIELLGMIHISRTFAIQIQYVLVHLGL